jgi:hypothetical protein
MKDDAVVSAMDDDAIQRLGQLSTQACKRRADCEAAAALNAASALRHSDLS